METSRHWRLQKQRYGLVGEVCPNCNVKLFPPRDVCLECEAPALKKGDVLFWHGKTIHGSLPTTQPQYSRSSFTAHYMPVSRSLLQLQVRQKRLNLREVNGMKVNFPKDQNKLGNKIIFTIETTFPKLFRTVKKSAIKLHSKL